ncbi:14276_t:CDS:2 [Racocetra fulgida]|uniref:14276_t:CDS:1 n=1 Tax=Racocetra fulgida TaxID=60492 RepID=A0A9N9GCD8_9GLOM|nr:14276_t:CDS:2 [Racocetra fulgida]
MSDYYPTSEEEFVHIDDVTSEEKEFDSSNSIENKENDAMMLPLQEVSSDGSFSTNRSKNKTSPVWNFMSEQKEGDKVIARICRKCGQKFSPTTTTRNLEKLYELCDAMNISDKVIALTTDNNSVMVLCGNLIEQE